MTAKSEHGYAYDVGGPWYFARAGFIGFLVLLVSLWDFYLGPYSGGIRIFDVLTVVLIAAVMAVDTATGQVRVGVDPTRRGLLMVFAALILAMVFVGAVGDPSENMRPAIGITLGFAVFLYFYAAEIASKQLYSILTFLLLIHIAALLLQLGTYYTTGRLLNYQAFVGGEPRVFSTIFRPSGLFQEPSSFSHSILLLLMIRSVAMPERRLDWVTIAGLASMVATVSLFGIFAAAFFALFLWYRRPIFWIAVALLGVVVIARFAEIRSLAAAVQVLDRLSDLSSDTSLNERYGGLRGIASGPTPWRFWIGRGVSNDYIGFGSSGYGFLINMGGVLGLAAVLSCLAALAPLGRRMRVFAYLSLSFLAAPIWTSLFWWASLALLTRPYVVTSRTITARG